MAFEQKPESGTLFDNDRKTSDKHPDRKGSALIAGVEYWVSGWEKTGTDGKKRISLAFSKKERQSATPAPKETSENPDDLPF